MEYDIRPIGKQCTATGADLQPGERVYSVLMECDGELVRRDYSASAWTGPPAGALGVWRATVPKPAAIRRNPLDPQLMLGFFEELTELANPVHERLRYVLALLLMRLRKIRLDCSREDHGESYLQFSGASGEGSWEVRDLNLSDADAAEVQAELNAHLLSRQEETVWTVDTMPSAKTDSSRPSDARSA